RFGRRACGHDRWFQDEGKRFIQGGRDGRVAPRGSRVQVRTGPDLRGLAGAASACPCRLEGRHPWTSATLSRPISRRCSTSTITTSSTRLSPSTSNRERSPSVGYGSTSSLLQAVTNASSL